MLLLLLWWWALRAHVLLAQLLLRHTRVLESWTRARCAIVGLLLRRLLRLLLWLLRARGRVVLLLVRGIWGRGEMRGWRAGARWWRVVLRLLRGVRRWRGWVGLPAWRGREVLLLLLGVWWCCSASAFTLLMT